MLAGCSSTLLSPRHRLRSEASAQYHQVCHFPSMSAQRLDLPCGFPRKDTSRSQSIRPVGLSVEKPLESKTSSCSLKQNIRLPPSATTAKDELWETGKSLKKRFAEQGSFDDDDESCINRAKRKRGSSRSDDCNEGGEDLSLGQLSSGNFWYQPSLEVPRSIPLITGPFTVSCSGEEDRVCFVPSDVISPPLPPLSNAPWVNSIVTEITELGDKNVETSHRPGQEASGSSASSESHSHSLSLKLNDNPSGHDIGNGSGLPNPNEGAEVVAPGDNGNRGEDDGFELISLLMACVEAIGCKNITGINHFIAKLGELASPRGSSISRLTAYFTEALALRVTRLWPHVFHITIPRELDRADDDGGTALRLLNQVSPIPKFIHFTSNEILLRAFEGKDRVHIIDFDIKQGLQWPSLFQSLASRANPPSHVRITGIGESKQELIETGDRLAGFAQALNLPFEFHPVVDRLEDVRLWMLHVKDNETVAVNCIFQLHKMLYDSSGGALRDFLGLIRSTNPSVLVMAEQEAEHGDVSLEARLSNSLKYYSAIFDCIDHSSLAGDSPVRMKIEEMFAREVRNIVACEGSDRVERHERFGKWRKMMMEQGGLRCLGITEREMLQGRMLLKMYSCENYYSVDKLPLGEEDAAAAAAITLNWLDQPLYTVSAWAPVDLPGSSSASHPQHPS
ncbi:scarecrow-like protein 28 [Diospyros lotus]|uniref:scarecrow-like protein 28 n=1 Tax=Diospyros lotus TaxID=55363 RepID=UPI002259BEAA|nr:scarecrow-like protein 28 [Diospyros lotus]